MSHAHQCVEATPPSSGDKLVLRESESLSDADDARPVPSPDARSDGTTGRCHVVAVSLKGRPCARAPAPASQKPWTRRSCSQHEQPRPMPLQTGQRWLRPACPRLADGPEGRAPTRAAPSRPPLQRSAPPPAYGGASFAPRRRAAPAMHSSIPSVCVA